MESNIESLSDRHKRVLPFLLSCKTIDEAAKQTQLTPKQVYEYLKDPLFKAELDRQRNEIVYEAIFRLKTYTTKAADTLAELLDSESEQIRRGAANDILSHTMKYMELHEMEGRLQALEKIVKDKT